MPFTIGGTWVSKEDAQPDPSKPVKVRLVKKGDVILTVVYNMNPKKFSLKEIASEIKKDLGIGGSVKEDRLEFQGDKVAQVVERLQKKGIKAS